MPNRAWVEQVGGISARNDRHGMSVALDTHGFQLRVDDGSTLAFRLLGVGRGEATLRPDTTDVRTLDGEVVLLDHGPLKLRYRNGPEGIRHDIIVRDRPAGTGILEAQLHIAGDLHPQQEGPDAILFHALEHGERVPKLRYSGLVVWDAMGDTLPSRMELRDDRIALVVDDRGARYPITIDPLSSTQDLLLPGTQAGAQYGQVVATAGDVNGDGYSDLLIGEPFFDGAAGVDAGRAMLHLGSATGVAVTPAWVVEGTMANAQLGASLSTAGDLNADGFGDLVVGAPGHAGQGAVLVFLGAATGPSLVASAIWSGDLQAGARFGHAVALAGDVNGDGRSDVLVGAPLYDTAPTQADRGRAYCYSGATMALMWSYSGITNNNQLGHAVAGAGDLNGDGVSDVAIGVPNRTVGVAANAGVIHLFQGAVGPGLPAVATATRNGSGANANFGYSIAAAGDMNGDGYGDLVVGAPGATSNNGSVQLFLGTPGTALVGATAVSVLAGTSTERLGEVVGLAGDVNGDGYADIVIGKPARSSDRGGAVVYRGGPTVQLDAAHLYWTRNGTLAGARLGAAVATAGDPNGDGISDLVVGAPAESGMGAVRVMYGRVDLPPSAPAWQVLGTVAQERLGSSIASAGDVNGDGYGDVIVGGDRVGGNGSASLYLGSATGLSPTPAWTGNGEFDMDLYGRSVASAGDVNGDGYADVLVGAPGFPNYAWRGKAYLYLGSPSGLSATPAWTFTGLTADERVGWSVSSGGDVNGDGYSDVLVGAYMFNEGQGKAYAFLGSATGPGATPVWTVLGTSQSFFGSCVSLAGDVNGDGYGDVAVGAEYFDGPAGHNEGAVFVYHGSASGLSAVPSWSFLSGQAGSQLGISVSHAGDVNGDGYSDLVVGAYRYTGTYSSGGRAYVFHGSAGTGLPPAPSTVLEGPWPDGLFGESVSSAGDVNADGYSDIVVGCPGYDLFYVDQGMAQVFLGSASGVATTASTPAMYGPAGAAVGLRFGQVVALAGDVDGDGYSDLAGSSWTQATNAGAVYLYEGNNARGRATPLYQYRSDLTTPVCSSNGTFDAGCEWGIGLFAHSTMGRARVKLVWHVVGHGPMVPYWPFNAHNNQRTGEAASWSDTGLPGVLLKQGLDVALATTGYPEWRVRLKYDPVTALDGRSYGRWHRQGAHQLQVPGIKVDPSACGPLPVSLVHQTVHCADGNGILAWTTATEAFSDRYEVMRSTDGLHWQYVGQVPAAGQATTLLHYLFEDREVPPDAVVYYRIDQYDQDGTATHFPMLPLLPCRSAGMLEIWPNPCHDEVSVRLRKEPLAGSAMQAELLDVTGRIVHKVPGLVADGGTVRLQGLGRLPAGSYLLQVRSDRSELLGSGRLVHH